MSNCNCEQEVKNIQERSVIITLLLINAVMFIIEFTVGLLSESTALIADSLDMLADAAIYGIAFYAIGKPLIKKAKAAHLSGILQVTLGLLVILEVIRRLVTDSEPDSLLMLVAGSLALVANLICLRLISKYKDGEVHMRASWIFSKNDVIANLGIIISSGFVYLFDSRYPDLIIGLAISLIVIRGGILIIKDASSEIAQLNSSR